MAASNELTAEDLLPLIARLSPVQRVRLTVLAGQAAAPVSDAERYAAMPPQPGEFGGGDQADPLAWDGEGWEPFYAAR